MEPFLYVMAILGCADGGQICEQQRLVQTRYVSQATCMQDSAAQLERNSDLAYPTIVARCQPIAARIAANDVKPPLTRR